MTVTTGNAPAANMAGVNGSVAPLAPPRRGNPRRRSPAMVSLGVVLVVLGAAAGWQYVGATAPATHDYLAVYQQVALGEQISQSDLQVVSITSAHGLTPIPASDLSSIVGKYAKVDLMPGTLLTQGEVTASNAPGPHQALIGLQLAPWQRPGRDLRPGDAVQLVPVTDADSTTVTGPAAPTAPIAATIVDVSAAGDDGTDVVDVRVASADAPIVAQLANQKHVAIVLIAGA